MYFSSRFLTSIFAATIALECCCGPLQEPPLSGSVITERRSPDKNFVARVIAAEAQGTYLLEMRDVRKGNVLAKQTIAAPVGYHAHIVSLMWSEDSRIVKATIDHDFGEDIRVFDLSTECPDT